MAPTLDDLIFVGLNGWVVAIHRDSGRTVWTNADMKSGYTTILLDGDRLVVSTNGYLYCLDPLTGRIVWENPLSGLRLGVASIASVRGSTPTNEAAAAAETAERQQHSTTTT